MSGCCAQRPGGQGRVSSAAAAAAKATPGWRCLVATWRTVAAPATGGVPAAPTHRVQQLQVLGAQPRHAVRAGSDHAGPPCRRRRRLSSGRWAGAPRRQCRVWGPWRPAAGLGDMQRAYRWCRAPKAGPGGRVRAGRSEQALSSACGALDLHNAVSTTCKDGWDRQAVSRTLAAAARRRADWQGTCVPRSRAYAPSRLLHIDLQSTQRPSTAASPSSDGQLPARSPPASSAIAIIPGSRQHAACEHGSRRRGLRQALQAQALPSGVVPAAPPEAHADGLPVSEMLRTAALGRAGSPPPPPPPRAGSPLVRALSSCPALPPRPGTPSG